LKREIQYQNGNVLNCSLTQERNKRDSELADPYTQMGDIDKMVIPTSQPKNIDPIIAGILEEGRKYLPTNRVEW
jgi:hypothetical protein